MRRFERLDLRACLHALCTVGLGAYSVRDFVHDFGSVTGMHFYSEFYSIGAVSVHHIKVNAIGIE